MRSDTNWLVHPLKKARKMKFWDLVEEELCSIRVAKTKALITCAVTVKLICDFGSAWAKVRFTHDAAHFITAFLIHSMYL